MVRKNIASSKLHYVRGSADRHPWNQKACSPNKWMFTWWLRLHAPGISPELKRCRRIESVFPDGPGCMVELRGVCAWQAAPSSDCSADESGSITTNRANLYDHRASFKSNLSDTDVMFLNVSPSACRVLAYALHSANGGGRTQHRS